LNPSTDDGSSLQRNPLSQHFVDRSHELRFREEWRSASIRQIKIALLLGVGLTLIFLPIDRRHLSADAFELLSSWRLYVMLPLLAFGFIVASSDRLRPYIFSVCALGIVTASLGFPLAARHGLPDLMYLTAALSQFLVLNFVLYRIPFPTALASGLAILASFLAAALSLDQLPWLGVSLVVGFTTITFLLALGAYQRDAAARDHYTSRVQLEESQRERIAWLGAFTRFIKHELGNQLAGIGSSLELISRNLPRAAETKYLARATTSVDRMRKLLAEAADATSLEAAIQHEEKLELEFDALVRERVETFEATFPDSEFRFQAERVGLIGNPIRLVQMVDNLLKNAVDHGSTDDPIDVGLIVSEGFCELSIENGGCPMPDYSEAIFRPWKDVASSSTYGEHFGVGLYIARKVAENHGGYVRASRKADGTGARLTVGLPTLRAEPDPRPEPLPAFS